MSKIIDIIDVEDILTGARNCVECILLAASGLGGGLKHDATDPIQAVADIASEKITEAIAMLEKYRESRDAGPFPVPAAIASDPAPWPTRTKSKRRGK